MNNGQNGFYYHGAPAFTTHALYADAAMLAALLVVIAVTIVMSVRSRGSRQQG